MDKKGQESMYYLLCFMVVALPVIVLFFPFPFLQYGSGDTYGVMTTIEEGFFYDSVWIRADYESSQTDEYCFHKDNEGFKEDTRKFIEEKKRVKLTYQKHLIGQCKNMAVAVKE